MFDVRLLGDLGGVISFVVPVHDAVSNTVCLLGLFFFLPRGPQTYDQIQIHSFLYQLRGSLQVGPRTPGTMKRLFFRLRI